MTPDEVLSALRGLGINTSRSTLLRFEKAGAFLPPKRGAGGRGQGRFTEYDEDTPKRFFATWMLMKAEKIPLNEAVAAGNLYQENIKVMQGELEQWAQSKQKQLVNIDDLHMSKEEWKTFMGFLNGAQDYDPFALHTAQKKVAEFLDNMQEFQGNYLIETESQVLADKWGKYYSSTKQTLTEVSMELQDLIELKHVQEITISTLEKENERLRSLLILHGISPD